MTVETQQDGAFRHPGDAKTDRSRPLHADSAARGSTVFIGYIRSQATSKADLAKRPEAWPEKPTPTVA